MDSLRKPDRPPRSAPHSSISPTPSFPPPKLKIKSPRIRNDRRVFLKYGLWIGALLAVLLIAFVSFVGYQAVSAGKAITLENEHSRSFFSELRSLSKNFFAEERVMLAGEEEGRINILLLGRAGESYPGKNLTDTVMIASIDTNTRKVALLSLPRDLYVPIPKSGFSTKLNSLYQYGINSGTGIEPLKTSVESITNLSLHYFAIIDFDGFEKVVDSLGGVQVEVMRDIYDDRYPGKNYSYETFELKKGRHTLDGKVALKYVRERHDDPEGDFGRAKRQQQVLQAMKDRAFSPGVFLNVFTIDSLLSTLGESVKTDMSLAEIESLLLLARNLDTENTHTVVIDAWKKESLLRTSHVMVGPTRVFILVPRAGSNNWKEISDVAENIFHRERLSERKTQITDEQATLAIFSPRSRLPAANRLRSLLREEWGITDVTLETLPLENVASESIIIDRSNLSKPFTLDELLKRFPLDKRESLPSNLTLSAESRETDLVIIVGSSVEEVFSLEENTGTLDGELESEALPPQPTTRLTPQTSL